MTMTPAEILALRDLAAAEKARDTIIAAALTRETDHAKELAETRARYQEQCELTQEMRANVEVLRTELDLYRYGDAMQILRAKAAALDAIEQWLGSTGLPDSFCTVYRSHNNDGKHAGYGCELGDDVEYDAVVSHAPTLAAAISAALEKARKAT